MQFQIPQFIETEDKIIGPLTLKQLLYLTAAGVLSFIAYFIFTFWLWAILTVVAGIAGISLAFVKYNGQPLIKVAGAALGFIWKPRLFLWRREIKDKVYEMPEGAIFSERDNLKFGMPAVKKLLTNLMTSKGPVPKREATAPLQGYAVIKKTTGESKTAKRVDYK
jgi:hypothetical protein